MEVEILDFKEPENGQLLVTKIHWTKSEFELKELIFQRFSSFGLLHWLKISQSGKTFLTRPFFFSC